MRRGLTPALIAALAVFEVGGLGEGEGNAARRIAVLGFAAEDLAPDVRQQFETVIVERLASAGYVVVGHGTTRDEITRRELAESCAFGPCVEPIGEALGVDRFLDVRIGADGKSYSFALSLVEARRGCSIDQVLGTCEVCTVAEALARVGEGVDALGGRAFAERAARAVTPAGGGSVTRVAHRGRAGKFLPALLAGIGLAATGMGVAVVSQTTHDDVGFVTIGSGGTVAVTGLLWLLVGD